MKSIFSFLGTALLLSACSPLEKADLIIHNAKIISVDAAMNTYQAMAIKDGKVVEIAAENQILNKYQSDSVVDAQQHFILPGLVDAHCHFLGYGLNKSKVDLVGTTSFEDVVDRIEKFTKTNESEWIEGRGWDQNDWQVKLFPTNDTLTVLFPDRKIVLKRIDGHAMLVTDNVLDAAGINEETKIAGGQILFEKGILIDEAMTLVEKVIPAPSEELIKDALLKAQSDCFAVGLTSVTDAGLEVEQVRTIATLQKEGQLNIRIAAMYSANPEILNNLNALRIETERLTAKSVKVYADGALGSRGAQLIKPYADDSVSNGLFITPKDSITKWAKACYDANFQLCVHCIGDQANRTTLDVMAKVLDGTNDRRWRIEHAQVVNPEDRSKYGNFNILPSMQPTHVTSDMYWAKERLGSNRLEHAYSTKSLMQENGMVALGTDFPVEGISPIETFYAAVTRQDKKGFPEGGFLPDQRLTREEALKGMTIWAAIASFDEDTRGSLEPGKFADFIILDRNILDCAPSEILEAQVLQTWVNGERVYEK